MDVNVKSFQDSSEQDRRPWIEDESNIIKGIIDTGLLPSLICDAKMPEEFADKELPDIRTQDLRS